MVKRAITMIMAAAIGVFGALAPASAAQPTETYFSGAGGFEGAIEGLIWVNDGSDNNVFEGSVKVKLFKRQDGAWVAKAIKQAVADPENAPGYWYVKFAKAPKSGTCKMVAIFSGTDSWGPSKGSIKGKCSDRNWLW